MSPRRFPSPDPYAVCPLDGPILPFYDGVFEAAYIVLHPFLRQRGASETDVADMTAAEICTSHDPVRWEEVRGCLNPPSLASVDLALRTSIGALDPAMADVGLAARLKDELQGRHWQPPVEGHFPALDLEPMLSFIQSLGHDWVWVGDELCTQRQLHWIEDLVPGRGRTALERGCVFTPDKSLLWTVHWDSHFSLLCSTRATVDRLALHPRLEGFVCGPETEVYWSVCEAGLQAGKARG